jgi:PAS domain S-box-containing protein
MFFLTSTATAGQPAHFVHLTVEQGLSQSTVQAILQDHVGFLWFGTEEGLNRFDGYTFVVFKHNGQDPTTLPDDFVSALCEDRQQRLWVGTEHGLSLFDRRAETFTRVPSIADRVTSIVEGLDGTLWVAAQGGGLFLLRPSSDSFASYQPDPRNSQSLATFRVSTLLQAPGGPLWIGTRDAGVDRFEPIGEFGRFVHHHHDPGDPGSVSSNDVWGLARDRAGNLWIATYGGGLSVLDHSTGTFRHYRHSAGDPHGLPSDLITTVFLDRSGTLWAGTDGAGLLEYDAATDRFLSFTHDPGDSASLSVNVVRSIYEDEQGQLWVGTFLGGVNLFRRSRPAFGYFTHSVTDADSLSDPAVASFLEDTSGRIWIGTEGGWLNRFDRDRGVFTRYRFPSEASGGSAILSLLEDRRGRIWAGSYLGGLGLFDPAHGAFRIFRHRADDPKSLGDDQVWAITEDDEGGLWLGTNAGLDRFDPDKGQVVEHLQISTAGGLSYAGVRSLLLDSRANLWVGGSAGLNLLRRGSNAFVRYKHSDSDPQSLSSDAAMTLYQDRQGRLWIGTWGGGLNLMDVDAGTFTSYRDFPSNVIDGIQEDTSGRLWLSTNHGLSRFDPASASVENFDLTNGLQSLQFHLGANLKLRAGHILFGSTEGFYELDPEAVHRDAFAPPVVLTSFRVFNEPRSLPASVTALREITLSHLEKVFSIEFAALDYSLPRRNSYSYIMEGFSGQWTQLGAKREVTFTNLDPGTYTFRVKASNSDGIWDPASVVALRVIVRPPFWATWWFRGLVIAAIALTIVSAHRLRVRRLTADLAERRRTESAIRNSEERYKALYEDNPSMYFTVDADGTVLSVNDFGAHQLGYTKEELVGRPVLDAFHQEDKASVSEALGKCLEDPSRVAHWEFRKLRKDGGVIWVKESARVVRGGDGKLVVLIVCDNITERKLAETALEASEGKFHKLFNSSPYPIAICLLEDGRFLDVNETFLRSTGYERDDLVGHTWREAGLWIDQKDEDGLREMVEARGAVSNWELNLRVKEGEMRPLLLSAETIDLAGKKCILVAATDIGERKKLEERLLQAQKMEAIGRMAGGLAHDFNNWLTPIIGFSELLLLRMAAGDPRRKEVDEVNKAGRQASALASQLLALSRQQVLMPKVLDLNDIVADMNKLLRRLIGEDIDLVTNLGAPLGRIKADPGQIQQVIMNLALNARDAMPRGGKLVIETSNVDLDDEYARRNLAMDSALCVMLAVSDTGRGIDVESQTHIFEPFFTTKEPGKGTGLGLSTVYGIVKQSGGHISVNSELDTGTTFKIYLPRVDESVDGSVLKQDSPLPRGSETILLVEDQAAVRRFVSTALRAQGYTVLEAGDPDEALCIIKDKVSAIHLLFTDVVMPRMSGTSLAARFLQVLPRAKVLYMSGYTGDAITDHLVIGPGVHFIQKPFTLEELVRKVRQVLEQ